jgi:hypothetical protein
MFGFSAERDADAHAVFNFPAIEFHERRRFSNERKYGIDVAR